MGRLSPFCHQLNGDEREMFNCKAIVAYKRPSNLPDILVHFKLDRTVNSAFVSKCNHLSIVKSNSLLSTTESTSNFTCASQTL